MDNDISAEIRLQVLRRDNCQCQACGKRPAGQVHEKTRPNVSGEKHLSYFLTLCGRCHMLVNGVPDWLIVRIWKILPNNIPLEKRIVQGRIKRKFEQLGEVR